MAFSVEFLHVIREDEILRIAQRLPAGGEILEVGGGTGFQARRLSEEGFHVRSIDVAASQYRGGRVFPVEDYDGVRFPFGDRTFDAVFSSNTIEHLSDPASFHAECFRVLKDGGKCVHAVPTAVWRVATSVSHYADLLRRIAEVPSRRGEGFLRRLRAAAGILRGGILPSRHGESGNFLAETWTFSRSGWRRHFRRYGLEVVRAEPLGLFYTGYMVRGATWPLAARRRLARWIGSSCALYEVRKCFPIAPPHSRDPSGETGTRCGGGFPGRAVDLHQARRGGNAVTAGGDGTPVAPRRSMARSVISGAGVLAASGVATKLFGIVSSPVLTRLVGPAPYGVVALAGTVSSLAATVGLLGVDLAYARHFFAAEGGGRDAVERFCWRFATCAGFLVAVLAGAGWAVLRSADGAALPLLVAGGALAAVFLPLATTRQRLRGLYGRIAAATVCGGALGVLAAIALAWGWRPDARAMLLGSLAGAAVTMLVVGLPPAETLLRTSGLSRARRGEVLRMGMSGVVTASMFWLMNSADRWLLGGWLGESTVGVYSFAAGIGTTGILVNNAMTLAWFPEMSREFEEAGDGASAAIGRLWGVLAGVLMVTWLAVSAAGGDAVRLLADRRFHDGAHLVPWIAGGVFFYGLAALANTGLILRMTMAPAAAWWTVGATLNVAANVVLIPRFGAGGAAVAACLGYGAVAAGTIRSAQRRHRLPIPWGRLGIAAVLTLAASAAMVRPWSASPAASLACKFPAGVVAAMAILRLTEPSWFARLLRIGRGGWKAGS